jgi:uncharacterized protein
VSAGTSDHLRSFEGAQIARNVARDPVNIPMIRQWCDAMGDANPVYLDEDAAADSVHGERIAPPTMLQAWCMQGFRQDASNVLPGEPQTAALEAEGFTSVVATNCEQEYRRSLHPGDLLTETKVVESISAEKQTALGVGHFVTTLSTYTDQKGEVVATMRFRLLRFKPNTGRVAERDVEVPESRSLRPRPSTTSDTAWWFEALREHKLLIQRCTSCGRLRNPVQPGCSYCSSLEWDSVESAGKGHIYSYVVNHYPVLPAFGSPLLVGLIELDEGIRLVANIVGTDPGEVSIGMRVGVEFIDHDEELTLPAFRPLEV